MRLDRMPRGLLAAVLASLPLWAAAQNLAGCGSIANAYGPYDFRHDHEKLPIVVNAHFTPVVEALIAGTSGKVGGDIDYTLRAIPNHPRALVAMTRLAERQKRDPPEAARYTIECYYDRALRFRPDDTTVRMLYASFLIKKARTADAERQLARVVELATDNGFTHFNAGLIYLEMKGYPQALQQAYRAMALGFARVELRDALKAAGQWKEPDPAELAVMAASAASAASPAASAAAPASAASR